MDEKECLEQLKISVERVLGKKLLTPKDYDYLSEHIFSRLHIMISATTLKRLWGYLKENTSPRLATFDVLSRFVGYRDWSEFCKSVGGSETIQSDIIISRSLSVEQLEKGDKVLVTWLPDRQCVFEFCGGNDFKVIKSENSKIKAGATFRCSFLIEGEPLFIDHLIQDGMPPTSYVAGKIDGIRFELIKK